MARILVVEDSPTQASEIEILLEGAGFVVEIAANGLDALRSIRQDAPDLVVTDLQMPEMDGLALVDAIRQDFPFVPVVLITAYGSETVASQALRDGAASYVPKREVAHALVPTVADLLAVVGQEVDRHRLLGTLTRSESEYLLENDPTLITPLVQRLEDQLAPLGPCDPMCRLRVGVALREALVNAMEHGNLELDVALRRRDGRAYRDLAARRRTEEPYRSRRVHVTARVTSSEAVYIVRDEGPGFDVAALTRADNSEPAGGRGFLLIRTFMDAVAFNDAGNEITLIRRPQPRTA